MAVPRSTQYARSNQQRLLASLRAGWMVAAALLFASTTLAAAIAIPLVAYAAVGAGLLWLARFSAWTERSIWLGLLADLLFPLWLLISSGGAPGPTWAPLLAVVAPAATLGGIGAGVLALVGSLLLAAGALALMHGLMPAVSLVSPQAPVLLLAALPYAALVVRMVTDRPAAAVGGDPLKAYARLEPQALMGAAYTAARAALLHYGVPEDGLNGAAFFGPDLEWQPVAEIGNGGGLRLRQPWASALTQAVDQRQPVQLMEPSLAFSPAAGGSGDNQWQSGLVIPFHAFDDCIGLLAFVHAQQAAFVSVEEGRLAEVGVEHAGEVQLANVLEQLRAERERLQELQEEARRKLARDLHDGPVQVIAAIAMRSNFAGRQIARDPEAARAELDKVESMARATTKAIRHMLFTLRPLILESRGLAAALRQYADKAADTHGQAIAVEIETEVEAQLTEEQQGLLFYIAEEAVMNAIKHAAAEHVWIRLQSQPEGVLLQVIDDGVGFNVGQVDAHYDQRGSLGLVTMRERAQLVPAELWLESEAGSGTQIQVLVAPKDLSAAPRSDHAGDEP